MKTGLPIASIGMATGDTLKESNAIAITPFRSEDRYRSFFENAAEGIFRSSPGGRFLDVNPAFARMLGFLSAKEMLETVADIGLQLHVRPDEYLHLMRILDSEGTVKGFETLCRMKGGQGEVWVSVNARTVRNENGCIRYYEGTITDITHQKRSEEEKGRLESQLLQAQKMEAVGQLAGGVAHDFNNLLTVIMGFANLVQAGLGHDSRLREYVKRIMLSSERAAQLTQSLLVFSRKQHINLHPRNIDDIVRNTAELLKRLLPEDIDLRINTCAANLTAMVDATQMDQVLINLATNARDAMPNGGALTIATAPMEITDDFVRMYGFGKPGEYVLLSVTDTGMGMDEETRQRIFEPFFTTKDVGRGTGLGLSTVYGIVKKHNGYITVSSKLRQGTSFHVYLPVAADSHREPAAASEVIPTGRETVLIAEDDPGVRTFAAEVLKTYGYTTIESSDGEEAVRVFAENEDKIDLVFLDVVMPKKNGKAVYDEIRRSHPSTKIVFSSGYKGEIIFDKGIDDETVDLIAKPFTAQELLQKVREVLDR